MRMLHVAVFIICVNFGLGITQTMGIFAAVPAGESASYASYSVDTITLVSGIIFGGAIGGAIANLLGYKIPLGAIAYSIVFGISAIPLGGTLDGFAASIAEWPAYLNTAILGIVGFIFVWGFIQLASIGGKGVE